VPLEYEWDDRAAKTAAGPHVSGPRAAAGSISACLVVRNEAGLIARCIDSLSGVVDEIIVVHDGPCADETLRIAEGAGCRVFEAAYWGHSEHHLPFAYEQARSEWLLTLDADEFLSPALRKELRRLTAAVGIDGYELLWRLWDGRRYLTAEGPHKLALVRRSAMRMVGVIHTKGEVDGVIHRVDLPLEHQPPYNNFKVATIGRKWGPRARLQAREYLTDLATLPRFGGNGTPRWTRRRLWTNRWAGWLVVPAAVHTFVVVMRDLREEVPVAARARFALTQAVYRGMVTLSVARERRRTTSHLPAVEHPVP
jgi:glycosyltransferase involved in cell wall biosynthesis